MSLSLEIPELETERLVMRAPSPGDFEAEAAFYHSDRSRHVGGPMPRDQAWRSFAAIIGHWVIRGFGFWAVVERETGLYCGRVGLWFPDGWPEPEIGWMVMGPAEGRGIAHEAAKRARSYAYDALGWTTVISLIADDNDRSKALAARMGAVWESAYEHPSYGPMQVYRHPGPEALA